MKRPRTAKARDIHADPNLSKYILIEPHLLRATLNRPFLAPKSFLTHNYSNSEALAVDNSKDAIKLISKYPKCVKNI